MPTNEKVIVELGIEQSAATKALAAFSRTAKSLWSGISKPAKKYGEVVNQAIVKQRTNEAALQKLIRQRITLEKAAGKSIEQLRIEHARLADSVKDLRDTQKGLFKEMERSSDKEKKALQKKIDLIEKEIDARVRAHKAEVSGGAGPKGGRGALGTVGGAAIIGIKETMKGIGGIAKALGPVLQTFGKLAPLLNVFSQGLTSVVTLLIDAEAGAKEMNKNILQAGGSAQFMSRNMNKGKVALADMEQTLYDIRNDATSLSNMSWGINKDDHMAMLNTLQAEGVELTKLQDQFQSMASDSDLAAAHAKSFAGTVQVAVAYSRNFGVSLQEISQFQGEMMSEMGMGLANVQSSFEMMNKAAQEAGVSGNKFFAQIRSMSADMGLFNNRMDQAVKVMTKLDKVMSPRNAAKFFQTVSGMFKGMGLTERVKVAALGGGATKKIAQQDIEGKLEGLANDLPDGIGKELKGIISKPKELMKWMAKHDKQLNGSQREAVLDAARQTDKVNKGGLINVASAMKDFGPLAIIDQLKAMSKNITGQSAENLNDVARIAMDQLGISDEMQDQLKKFESSLDLTKETIAQKMDEGNALTDEERAMVKKLGITYTDGQKNQEAGDKLRSKDSHDVWNNMSKSQQDLLKDSTQTIDYNKKTSEFTSTISDKIGVLVDFVMNQLYNVMSSVWETLTDIASSAIFGGNTADKQKARLEAQIAKTRNKELMDIAAVASDQKDFMKRVGESDSFKDLGKALRSYSEEQYKADQAKIDELTKKIDAPAKTAEEAAEKQKLVAERDKLEKEKQAKIAKKADAESAITGQLGGQFQRGSADYNSLVSQRLGQASFGAFGNKADMNKLGAARTGIEQGKNVAQALQDAGYSAEEQAKMMEELTKTLSPQQLGKALGDFKKAQPSSTTPGAPGTPGAPSEQAQAAAKASGTPPVAATPAAATPAPTPAPAAPAPAGPPAPAQVAAASKVDPPTADQQDVLIGTLDDVQNTLRRKGIRLDKAFMRDPFWTGGHDAVLDATREALFEYFLYSKMDPNQVSQGVKSGAFDAKDFGKKLASYTKTEGRLPGNLEDLKGYAQGGIIPEPKSPDSVFVAARPGETILPRGAGAGGGSLTIPINVNGPGAEELAGMMRAAAINVIAEWKRKNRFT